MKAFYQGNIYNLLKFLRNQNMKTEYVYFLSSYLYIAIVNGWLDFSNTS